MKKFNNKLLLFFFSFFLIFFAHTAFAANLSVSPVSGAFRVGDKIVIKVLVASRVPINAISGVLNIPTSIFTIESISKSGSVLNFWVTEPNFSKGAGVLSFEGVTLGGFPGGTKTVVMATLRVISVGTGTITFKSGQILANDGAGTDITDLLTGATFSVKEAIPKTTTPKIEPMPEPEISQPAPTLKAPEIALSAKYGVPAIIGASNYPKAQVLMTFIAQNGSKVFILDTADADGNFNLLVPNSLKRGFYTVTAVIIKEDKTNSTTSNTIIVKIGNIFSDLGWEIQLVILLLIIAILYLLLRAHSHFGKNKNIHKAIRREVNDAQNVAHRFFDILREDVIDYDNKKLTSVEHKRMSGIKKDIDDAEKVIDKEIKDIESV